MTLTFSQITLIAVLLSGILTSCETFGDDKKRQALLDHHLKLEALDSTTVAQSKRTTRSDSQSATTQTKIIMPLGDPQPLVDEVNLAPEGPSKPFAADPVDEVGLFPED